MALGVPLFSLIFVFFTVWASGLYEESGEIVQNSQTSNAIPQERIEEPIVIQNKDLCLGCPTKINKNVEGISPMLEAAVKDVESERDRKQVLLELVDLERQIVNGIKFGLTFKVASTVCQRDAEVILESCVLDETIDHEYCKVDFLQKVWLSKDKFIINNNCTTKLYTYPEAQLAKEKSSEMSSEKSGELSLESLRDLESQIILDDDWNAQEFEDNSNLHVPRRATSEESQEEFWEGDNYLEIRRKRQLPATQNLGGDTSEESKSNETSISSEEHRRVPRGTNKDSSSSSSSSSDDDDDNNDINNNNNNNKKSKKESLKKADENDDNDTSSSSSSSSDDDNNNNNNHKHKRAIDLNPEKEEILIMNLGKYAIALLDKNDGDLQRRVLLSVEKVQKREIEGVVYYLNLKVANSHCDEEVTVMNSNFLSDNRDGENCKEMISDSEELCQVRIHISESFTNPKVLHSHCHKYPRNKRSLGILGGVSPTSVDNPEIIELAESTLKLMDGESDHSNKLKIIKIHEATTQVVSGSLTKIKADIVLSDCPKTDSKHPKFCGVQNGANPKTCTIEIWDQPWLPNGRKTKVNCGGQVSNYRSKRDLGDSLNVSPHAVLHVLDTLELLNAETSFSNKLKPVKILKAFKQGDHDHGYTIHFIAGVSLCPKGDPDDIMFCPLDNRYPVFKCKLVTWKNGPRFQDVHRTARCLNGLQLTVRKKRQAVGAPRPLSVDDPEVINLTHTAIQLFDSTSSNDNKHKVIEIQEATSQVVAGVLYKIIVEIKLSDCLKTDPKESTLCGEAKEAESEVCTIEIWSRPWLKVNGTLTTVTCDKRTSKFRTRRSATEVLSLLDEPKDSISLMNFDYFIRMFNVTYGSIGELKRRFKIFNSNLNTIMMLNKFELGTGKYGITRFTDLTQKEFKQNYLGLKIEKRLTGEVPFPQAEIPDIELPKEFDWREKKAVTPVKDQASCGSCWAFSTTGNIEGQYAIKYGNLLEFSEQELVDCDTYDEGCGGGLMDNAYRAIEKLGGLELESDYPYDAKNEKCHFNKTLAKVQLSGAVNISQNEDDMAKWLTANGPISIAINANAMQFYVGGVSHPWRFLCSPKNLDHGVLIVGYGVHSYPNFNKTLPYWLVKNSWGKKWGEQGYYRVYRGDGTCGVNQTPSSAIVA